SSSSLLLLVFLVAQKLDKSSRKAWELKLGDAVEYPSYHDSFLAARIRALDALAPATQTEKSPPNSKKRTLASHIASAAPFSCTLCKENHLLYQCPTFLKQTPSQRFEFIKTQKRCSNCFGVKHSVKDCKSTRACKRCSKRHHTLLHFDASAPHVESEQPSTTTPASSENSTHITSHLISKTVAPKSQILLATALIRVYSPHNRFITVRALLDQGSVSTFITESLAQRLRLSRMNCSVFITGISEMQSVARHAAQITITPASSEGPAYTTTALILRSLTKYMPSRVRSAYNWKHLTGLQLADRDPMSSEPIDVIIGADLVGMLVLEGVRQGNENEPTAQNTTLGWILSGSTASVQTDESKGFHLAHHGVVLESLDRDLRRFWEIEEVPQPEIRSPEEHQCEEHFRTTHSRTPEGRYVVRLPFKNGPPISLGESRQNAITSLHRLDRRLCRDPRKASEYSDFLAEYETLGHMTKSPPSEIANQEQAYYIPHHAVLRDTSATTRLRVVFNASCRTSNGLSLNDHMLIGPKLQKDLAAILLQWRQYRYVFIADIPPAAPHFGGLWEAGVKSVKHHLRRCIGRYTLTYEEMSTLLCRIEACLNSRPIAPVSNNLDDYHAITPGHFLIGTPILAPAEPSVLNLKENRLSRWQMVQRIAEEFWRSWSRDYLHTLQQRPKWRTVLRLAKVGQIVLVRNELAPPSHWELGRIIRCHPGNDELTRVVTVKTSRSEYKRPIAKLCFLPVDLNTEDEKDSAMAGGIPM
ncbi:hypothetical protein ALC62_07192, partial [Cyphomyrmex costatus]